MRDLGFAFNDKDFSDRILHLEMIGGSLDSESDSEPINKKQKTGILEEKGDVAYDYHSKCSKKVEVKTLHINSAILAGSSPFFYKLFKNGTGESQQKEVTLRINASEEAAMMDLLNFMYSNTLSATSVPELVGVLIIADKFEVSSCMSYCCKLLKEKPMSREYALLYLELPSSVLECVGVQPILDTAKKYFVKFYRNVTRFVESLSDASHVMALPLSAIESLLGSDSLQVRSEEDVYNFILLWGRARYPKLEERREILTKLLGRFLHFPYLSLSTLEQIQECPDFDSKEISKLILKSLYLNTGFPYGQRYHFPSATRCMSMKRDYNYLHIKELQFETSCIIFLNLTKEKCWDIFDSGKGQYSQPFRLGGVWFALYVEAKVLGESDYYGLFVGRQWDQGDGTCMFNYEIAVMEEWSKEFECHHKDDNCTLTGSQRVGSEKMFQVPSSSYFEDGCDSEHVIDGVVRVRAEFTIINSQA